MMNLGASIALMDENDLEQQQHNPSSSTSSSAASSTLYHPDHAAAIPVGMHAALLRSFSTGTLPTHTHSRSGTFVAASGSPPSSPLSPLSSIRGISAVYIQPPPIDQAGQEVSKEGFLTKLGGNVKNWKTRYFRLCPGRLFYYKDGESSKSSRLGCLLLPGASLALFSSDVYPPHSFCFGLQPSDSERQYIFSCDSSQHRAEWLEALQPFLRQRIRVLPTSLREGYLTKLGGKVKNWKKRYIVLTYDEMLYYSEFDDVNDRACSPLGRIPLKKGFVLVGNGDTPSQMQQHQQQHHHANSTITTTAANTTAGSPTASKSPNPISSSAPAASASSSIGSSAASSASSSSSPSPSPTPTPDHARSASAHTVPSTSMLPAASQYFLSSNPYNFSLRAVDSTRTYVFCTTTKQERDGWVGVLQEIQKYVKQKGFI